MNLYYLFISLGVGLLLEPAFGRGAAAQCAVNMTPDWMPIGTMPRLNTSAMPVSGLSVGAETMDRNYTVFNNWRGWLPALSAKTARVQAGWARCEPVPGVYDWAWLDEIVTGMTDSAVAVVPWLQLSYGNPVYPSGGTPESDSPLPSGDVALAAWDAWVTAVIKRYGLYVHAFEVRMRVAGELHRGDIVRADME
jgi:hypothetical protein